MSITFKDYGGEPYESVGKSAFCEDWWGNPTVNRAWYETLDTELRKSCDKIYKNAKSPARVES